MLFRILFQLISSIFKHTGNVIHSVGMMLQSVADFFDDEIGARQHVHVVYTNHHSYALKASLAYGGLTLKQAESLVTKLKAKYTNTEIVSVNMGRKENLADRELVYVASPEEM